MRNRVEGFTEVQYYHVCLLPSIVGLEEVMQCDYQLRLTGVAGSEAVISVSMLCLSRWFHRCRQTMCSRSLQATEVRETGL